MVCPVDLTQKLVQTNSVNPPGQERQCVDLLKEILVGAGFETRTYEFADGRANLVARFPGNGEPPICFSGHLDTVPLGKAPWSVDPFAAEIVGDKLFGRGASDMKSGVAAIVSAAVSLAPDIGDGPGIALVFTAGEETGCEGARFLASLDREVLGDAGAVVVGEMTANQPLVGHKGAIWLDVFSEGVTSHGSTPEKGVNAVYKGARIVTKLEDFALNSAPHEVLGGATVSVGRFEGGTSTNTVPDFSRVSVDVRTIPGIRHSALREHIKQYLGSDASCVETTVDLTGVFTNPEDEWMQHVFSVVARHQNNELGIAGAPYFTDASILRDVYRDAPVVILGPGEPDQAHRTDEYCLVSRIETATLIYKDLMSSWMQGAVGL